MVLCASEAPAALKRRSTRLTTPVTSRATPATACGQQGPVRPSLALVRARRSYCSRRPLTSLRLNPLYLPPGAAASPAGPATMRFATRALALCALIAVAAAADATVKSADAATAAKAAKDGHCE